MNRYERDGSIWAGLYVVVAERDAEAYGPDLKICLE